MKWKKPFFTSIITLTFLVVLTMGCNEETPTSPQPSGPDLTDTPKVTYVGDNACKACHSESYENVIHTKHYDAFKPLADFPLDKPVGEITIFDPSNKENPASTTLDFSNDKVYGVMQNSYVIAEVPPTAGGFENKVFRVGKLKKTDDKWTIEPPKEKDVNNDGKNDWTAESYSCGPCHSPGIENASPDYGISCESCHGPGDEHVSGDDKKTSYKPETARNSCNSCHESNPSKDDEGNFTVTNHYGTRNYFASNHAQSSQMTQCLACHSSHNANAEGSLLLEDKGADVCAQCHAGKTFNLEELMWKNPTDAHNHFSKDHSFGAIKYEDLQDDPDTKPVEIKNPTVIELIKKQLPELAK